MISFSKKNHKKIIPTRICITGASSGLGRALAVIYARSGVELFLCGRNQERLSDTALICRAKGAAISTSIIDVTDQKSMESWINSIAHLDLVIANAGISAGTSGESESLGQVSKIFNTNILGVVNSVMPAIEKMKNQHSGQIVIISSMAGILGLPSCPTYSASKAAVKVFGEALRENLRQYNIGVTVVLPGYIKTAMTKVNNFPMPLMIRSEQAAAIIKEKLEYNPAKIAFPKIIYWVLRFAGMLPQCMICPILRRLPAKEAMDS